MNIRKFWFLVGLMIRPASVFAQNNYMGGGHMYGYGHMMNSWSGAIIMGLVVLIVIVILVYVLVRASGTGTFGPTLHETPLEILKKRYARGEISKEQFEDMKKDL